MKNKKITKKQEEVLSTIKKLTKNGVAPTLKEIQERLGYKTTSSVQRHTEALKKKGYIISDKYQKRTLEVREKGTDLSNIPLVGEIPCGSPILAVENIEAYIPHKVNGDPKEYFFLKAIGDSMDRAGINDGDLVLVKKQPIPNIGDRVVALVGDEATIKIFKQGDNCVILEPKSTNQEHKPLYIFEDLQIQGKVVDVIKINK